MAATAVAYPLDSVAGAYNPAGMGIIGDRFDAEAAWVHDTGHGTISDNLAPIPPEIPLTINGTKRGMRTRDAYPAGFGLNKDWCFCDGEWKLSTGAVFFNQSFQKTTYNEPLLLFGTSNTGLEYLHQVVAPTFAVTWCDRHTIGVSVNYNVQRVKVNGLQNFDTDEFTSAVGAVTNRGYGYSTGWGATIGYVGNIWDNLNVGVVYRPKTTMTKFHKYRGFFSEHGKFDIPQKVSAGIAYRVMPCLVVAFDFEWLNWKQIKALANNLLQSDGSLTLLGLNNGPGFGFKDQYFYRLGVEWQALDSLSLRIGYRYANTPIKGSQNAVNLLTLDVVENYITTGATWAITDCNEVSFLFAWGFENTVKGKNAIPAEFGGGNVNLTEQKYALGLALGHKF